MQQSNQINKKTIKQYISLEMYVLKLLVFHFRIFFSPYFHILPVHNTQLSFPLRLCFLFFLLVYVGINIMHAAHNLFLQKGNHLPQSEMQRWIKFSISQ